MQPQYRQGDVFLLQVEELPTDVKEESNSDRIVLAYGEATGHSHSVSNKDARLYNLGDQNFLVVETTTELVHQEHDAITLRAGVYRVVRQREYEPIRGTEYVSD